ncbi:MAG: cytochrome b/b6 domain-containing protein [Bacteroidales bacterium]|nr:cytochrome b/b6 domain-containing protein [Bacteroidales bacterium]MDY0215681.1 cytochrome b/b6 domain-containing protein [Bacteroidales bacterium]
MENSKYSIVYRIIHFAMVILFLLLLGTIFLKFTFLNKSNVAAIIQGFLTSNDLKLSQEQLNDLAKLIRQPMMDWHNYIGYGLVGLFAIRFALPFFGKMKYQNPFDKSLTKRVRFQKILYIVFYVCTIVSLISGVLIEFGSIEYKELMKDIHALSIYYLIPFVVIHIAGVLMGEFTDQKGIISRIVNGTEEEKNL